MKQSANEKKSSIPKASAMAENEARHVHTVLSGGIKKSKKEAKTPRFLPGGCERILLYGILDIRFILNIKAH